MADGKNVSFAGGPREYKGKETHKVMLYTGQHIDFFLFLLLLLVGIDNVSGGGGGGDGFSVDLQPLAGKLGLLLGALKGARSGGGSMASDQSGILTVSSQSKWLGVSRYAGL